MAGKAACQLESLIPCEELPGLLLVTEGAGGEAAA
jgi:hypothetical protein